MCLPKNQKKKEFRFMFKYFLSASVIFVLLFSNLVTAKTKKCPIRMPDSLVSLYTKSDLVVIGEIKSEKIEKVLEKTESYTRFLVKQDLQVEKTLKGIHTPQLALYKNDYQYKQTQENNEVVEVVIDVEGVENPRIEGKALFFLKKDADKQLRLTDYNGVKVLDENDLTIYENRIKELSAIIKNKKNQTKNMAEWLVKCVEQPTTEHDGSFELNRSFYLFQDEKSEAEEEAKAEKPTQTKNVIPDIFANNYFNNSSEIWKNLTDSQKDRLVSAYFKVIQKDISDASQNNSRVYTDWELSNLAKNVDKQRVIFYVYAQLQSLKTDKYASLYLMENVADLTNDENLYDLRRAFEVTISRDDSEIVSAEEIEETATNQANNSNEKSAEEKTQTYAQYREKILKDFDNRYQKLVANNFEPIEEDKVINGDKTYEEPAIANDNLVK
jgi:hypothetical protein